MKYLIAILTVICAAALAHAPAKADGPPPPKRPATKVKAFVERAPEPICGKTAVSVVGSQYLNEPGAEESAQKAWHEAVRFHHGEAYMDLARARDYRHRCSRSSIGEALGQIMHRCEVSAIPCKPPMTGDK